MSSRTLKVTSPAMRGDDAAAWERTLNAVLRGWGAKGDLLRTTGAYTVTDRGITASILYGYGVAPDALDKGVTPELRTKIRNKRFSEVELNRYREREGWRRRLVDRLEEASGPQVHRLVAKILTDTWGYHPGVHDGIDLMCPEDAFIYAPVRSRVVDVRSSSWWGLGARPTAGHPVSDGDGIIQIETLVTVGPITKGLHLGYGHAEHARVRVGQVVEAGEILGRAGWANGSHVHFMVNRGNVGNRGVGNVDPRKIVDYTKARG